MDQEGDPTFTTSLTDQKSWLFEAGYYFGDFKLEPFVQIANQDYDAASASDNSKVLLGIAYWGSGHKWNVKLAGGRISTDVPAAGAAEDRNTVVLQAQALFF